MSETANGTFASSEEWSPSDEEREIAAKVLRYHNKRKGILSDDTSEPTLWWEIDVLVRHHAYEHAYKLETERLKRTENWWIGLSLFILFVMASVVVHDFQGTGNKTLYQDSSDLTALYLLFCAGRQWAQDDDSEGMGVLFVLAAVFAWGVGGTFEAPAGFAGIAGLYGVGIAISLIRYALRRWKGSKEQSDGTDC